MAYNKPPTPIACRNLTATRHGTLTGGRLDGSGRDRRSHLCSRQERGARGQRSPFLAARSEPREQSRRGSWGSCRGICLQRKVLSFVMQMVLSGSPGWRREGDYGVRANCSGISGLM
ncbi:hypothetical protein SKAU_G00175260 [Synaphobranchus kaupii]|uniref:Uncharacterized protein n=1 Tax=Synaphobranchus kaupii TaxID=118154 RepID=A0A9Q1FLB7_SYNKA|nr:hypothetical protein SKAU_G00175260 [Synaphobranchus kaupii]